MGVVPVGSAARVARPARQGWVAAAAVEGGAAAATVVASVVTSAVGWRWVRRFAQAKTASVHVMMTGNGGSQATV